MPQCDLQPIEAILARTGTGRKKTLAILQAIQQQYGYLPTEGDRGGLPPDGASCCRLWGVATFYDQFRLTPAGKHTSPVCVRNRLPCQGSRAGLMELPFDGSYRPG